MAQTAWTRERRSAFQQLMPELIDIFKQQPMDSAIWLQVRQYISTVSVEQLRPDRMTVTEKAYTLLTSLALHDRGWEGITSYLATYHHANIVQQLYMAEQDLLSNSSNNAPRNLSEADGTGGQTDFIANLRTWTLNDCQKIRDMWGSSLNTQGLENAYVRLDFATEVFSKQFAPEDLERYRFLDGPEKRIVISGEPGIGKSTFLNKLAYDWASQCNKELSSKFQYLFIMRCGHLNKKVSLTSELSAMLGEDEDVIEECFKKYEQRILLLLDGFDELKTNVDCHWLDKLLNLEIHVKLKCVITARQSHVDLIKRKNLSLRVQGFGLAEQKEYLKKQCIADMETQYIFDKFHSLENLARRPFFLNIVCVLAKYWHQDGKDFKPSPASALFELMRAYHEWLFITNNEEKKHRISEKEFDYALVQTGGFAYSQVIAQQCKDPAKLPNISIVAPTKDEMRHAARLGLLSVERRRTSISGTRFVDNYVFLHQLFAEYLCAVYLAWLLERDQVEPSHLTNVLNVAESPVSYFLSGFSQEYLASVINITVAKTKRWPWIADGHALLDLFLQENKCATSEIYLHCGSKVVSTRLLHPAVSTVFPCLKQFALLNATLDEGWPNLVYSESLLCTFEQCVVPEPRVLNARDQDTIRYLELRDCSVSSFSFLHMMKPLYLCVLHNDQQSDIWRVLADGLKQQGSSDIGMYEFTLLAGSCSATSPIRRDKFCHVLQAAVLCRIIFALKLERVEISTADLLQLCSTVKKLELMHCHIIKSEQEDTQEQEEEDREEQEQEQDCWSIFCGLCGQFRGVKTVNRYRNFSTVRPNIRTRFMAPAYVPCFTLLETPKLIGCTYERGAWDVVQSILNRSKTCTNIANRVDDTQFLQRTVNYIFPNLCGNSRLPKISTNQNHDNLAICLASQRC